MILMSFIRAAHSQSLNPQRRSLCYITVIKINHIGDVGIGILPVPNVTKYGEALGGRLQSIWDSRSMFVRNFMQSFRQIARLGQRQKT